MLWHWGQPFSRKMAALGSDAVGVPMTAVPAAGALSREGGVGLRNTRERLAQLYGAEHAFTLEAAPGGGVVASVTIPYHTRADLHAAAPPDVEPAAART